MAKATSNLEIKKIDNAVGERFIGAGAHGVRLEITGTPGNALGCYLDGAEIIVKGNSQDAVGDTMNSGEITVHGSAGDALGLGMRGGKIFIRDNAGYRAGIHMKEYKDKIPVIVIGGTAGSFLGEYIAGGTIVVLNLKNAPHATGDFTGTGMHGGRIFIRTASQPEGLPKQVVCKEATAEDKRVIEELICEYVDRFGGDAKKLLADTFYMLTPNAKNPYKQLYCHN